MRFGRALQSRAQHDACPSHPPPDPAVEASQLALAAEAVGAWRPTAAHDSGPRLASANDIALDEAIAAVMPTPRSLAMRWTLAPSVHPIPLLRCSGSTVRASAT